MTTIPLSSPASISQHVRLVGAARLLPMLLLCCLANALSAAQFGDFTYTNNVTSVTINAYTGTGGAVAIPATIDKLPVTSFDPGVFSGKTSLKSVTIPNGITTVGMGSFSGCSNLASVMVGTGVIGMQMMAFGGCTSLTTICFLGNAPQPLGDPFANAGNVTVYRLVETAGWPTPPAAFSGRPTALWGSLFSYTSNGAAITLTGYNGTDAAVFIPPTIEGLPVTIIGDGAFQSNATLTSVTIPDSVTMIGSSVFYGCTGLTTIAVDDANLNYRSVDGVLFDKTLTTLLQYPGGRTGPYTIPSSVTSVTDGAFEQCSGLTSVTIPSSVTSIGRGVFHTCTGMTSVTIPGSVTSIGRLAFYGCVKLTSVTIPGSVTSIGTSAFYGCTALTSLTISEGVISIGSGAFALCSSLTSVIIPGSVTNISGGAFAGFSGLPRCSLISAIFMGNAPTMTSGVFSYNAAAFTVYYYNGRTGFTSPTWLGYPAVNLGDASPIETWLRANGLPYNANLQADEDGDGVTLLMAYALNLNPNLNLISHMPRPVIAGNQVTLSFYAGSKEVTYSVETSVDLKIWSADGVTISGPDANYIRTATVNITGPQRYMRIVMVH